MNQSVDGTQWIQKQWPDEIRKFFPGFDGTLPIQYHEPKLINIVLSYITPWPNINNLTKYCVMIVHGWGLGYLTVFIVCFIVFFLNFIHIHHLICFYVLYSFSHPATIFNKLELSWVELISGQRFALQYSRCIDHRRLFMCDQWRERTALYESWYTVSHWGCAEYSNNSIPFPNDSSTYSLNQIG